jgi:hypothetical protein
MIRPLLLALAASALLLAACGDQNASKGNQPAANGSNNNVVLGSTRNMPDWLLVARQRDCDVGESCPRGEVHFNQRTITRNADGTADIWVQVRHGARQLYNLESETTQTTIRYDVERLHYRFNCATGDFIVVERQIMGAGETVVARDEPRPIYRQPGRGSATAILLPIACRGS